MNCFLTCGDRSEDDLLSAVINREATGAQDVQASNPPQGNAEAPLQEGEVLNHARDEVRVQRANLDAWQRDTLHLNRPSQRLQQSRRSPHVEAVSHYLVDHRRASARVKYQVHIFNGPDGCFDDDQIAVVETERNFGLLPFSVPYISCCGRSRASDGDGY